MKDRMAEDKARELAQYHVVWDFVGQWKDVGQLFPE